MNPGAHLISPTFPEFETARKVLGEVTASDWTPTHPDGPYKSDGWRVVKIVSGGKRTEFVDRHPEIAQVLDYFKDPITMAVFYSMLPGAEIHPHRDLSGTLELGKVRYHVPIETNPDVYFWVDKKRVPMQVGQMWALNTSYLHAVANRSTADRVHLVVEVETGKWSWAMLPAKGIRYYAHYASFMTIVACRAMTKLLTDKNAIQTYSGMSKTFMNRLLRRKAA
jgi:aspartyl/asparaginyl beta-hydroxylase